MKKVISLIFILCLGINIFAQMGGSAPSLSAEKGMIKGSVKENSHKTALEYANILVYSIPDSAMVSGTITNPQGSFEIKDLSYGKYYIIAEFIGFKKRTIPDLEISKENKVVDCGEIVLEPSEIELGEVNVTAEKNLVMYQIDKKVVNIDKKLTAAGGNLVDALENTPSIQVDAEGNVTLRGSSNFTVLIDGKPTALAGNDALKQIPASTVSNIEVITNPSAKFDPDGSAGIINIIMKKEYKKGMNGIVNASIGKHFQHNGDFNLNFRQEKVNFFIGGSYADRRRFPSTTILNTETKADEIIEFIQTSDREQNNKNFSLKAGLDFYASPKSTITASGEYGFFGFDMLMPSYTKETSSSNLNDKYYIDNSDLELGGHFINSNLNFEQKFNDKGHKILMGLTFSKWDGTINSGNEIDTTDQDWVNILTRNKYRTIQNDFSHDFRSKIDYTLPINDKTTIEAGYQGRYKTVDSEYSKENYYFDTNLWNKDSQFDNGMFFKQNIHSLYFTMTGKIIGLNTKIGLRGEYSTRLLTLDATDEIYSLDLIDLFPTLHFSKKLGETREIQASYSRRINRPNEWNLSPLPVFSSSKAIQVGNPDLKPEYVDSYELNFMKNLKKGFVSFETYYRQTNNAFEQTVTLEDNSDIRILSTANLNKNFSYGIELSSNLNLAKWISLYASANIYSYNVQGEDLNANIKANSLNSDFVLNTNIMNKKGSRLQISAFYNAPKVTTQGRQSEMYGINTALRQEFMKKKLVGTLRVNDVFNTMKFRFNSRYGNNDLNFTFDMDSPTVILSLSYTLNNYKKRADDNGEQPNLGPGIL